MTFDEWIDKLLEEMKKKYKILDCAVTVNGMMLDFDNTFRYFVSLGTLKNLWAFSIEDELFRWDDSFDVICKSINREYMKQILN